MNAEYFRVAAVLARNVLKQVRHALAIDLLRKGADISDVQAQLGHASIETTRRFYAGILTERQKLTSERLAGRLTLPKQKPAGASQPSRNR